MKHPSSMKIFLPWAAGLLLLVACQREQSFSTSQPGPERESSLRVSGAAADDPAKIEKVPLIVSRNFSGSNGDLLLSTKRPRKGGSSGTDSSGSTPPSDTTATGGDSGGGTVVLPPSPVPGSFTLQMPPVSSQGSEGSCVAWAVTYARSADQFYKTNASSYSYATNIFSPEFLFNQTKSDAYCSSSTMWMALEFLVKSGVCTWQSMPYSSANGCSLLPSSSQTAEAANYRIASYSKVYTSDLTALKTLLANKRALVMSLSVDNSFVNAKPGFIWKAYSETPSALHAVAVCGYDDAKNAFKIINSWGTTWGDAGYTWIDYNFFKNLASFVYVMNY